MLKGTLGTIALIIVWTLLGCGGESTGDKTQHKADYRSSIIIGIPKDVDTFNPLYTETAFAHEINHLMLLGLADLDDKSDFQPELSQSWEFAEDNLSLTYHLRPDMRWADGHPISAEDVEFTYELIADPVVASPQKVAAELIKKVEIVDSLTVRFHFKEPYPYQVFDTAEEILPKHVLEGVARDQLRGHAFGRNPLASGPYKLKQHKKQQYIELERNENYFGPKPHLEKIVFKIVPDETNLLTQLRSGEIDMMIGVPPAEVDQLKKANSNINIYPVSGRLYYYVGYNESLPKFQDPRVRQALTMAMNRQEMIDALLYGFGKPCVGHIPPMIDWAYNDNIKPLPYDIEAAKDLMARAGWKDSDGDGWLDKNGKIFEFSLKTDGANTIKSDIVVVIQQQLKAIGIKVALQPQEWTALMGQLKAKDFEAHLSGWSTSLFIDPTPVFHSSATDLFNYGSYANPQVDQLIEKGRAEMDRDKAAATWKTLQEIVYQDQHYSFLFWVDRVVAVNSRYANVNPVPLSSLYELEKWYDSASTEKLANSTGN